MFKRPPNRSNFHSGVLLCVEIANKFEKILEFFVYISLLFSLKNITHFITKRLQGAWQHTSPPQVAEWLLKKSPVYAELFHVRVDIWWIFKGAYVHVISQKSLQRIATHCNIRTVAPRRTPHKQICQKVCSPCRGHALACPPFFCSPCGLSLRSISWKTRAPHVFLTENVFCLWGTFAIEYVLPQKYFVENTRSSKSFLATERLGIFLTC